MWSSIEDKNPAYYPWEMLSENMHAVFEPLSEISLNCYNLFI